MQSERWATVYCRAIRNAIATHSQYAVSALQGVFAV